MVNSLKSRIPCLSHVDPADPMSACKALRTSRSRVSDAAAAAAARRGHDSCAHIGRDFHDHLPCIASRADRTPIRPTPCRPSLLPGACPSRLKPASDAAAAAARRRQEPGAHVGRDLHGPSPISTARADRTPIRQPHVGPFTGRRAPDASSGSATLAARGKARMHRARDRPRRSTSVPSARRSLRADDGRLAAQGTRRLQTRVA